MQSSLRTLLIFLLLINFSCSSDDEDCEEGSIEYTHQVQIDDAQAYKESGIDCRFSKIQEFTASMAEKIVLTTAEGAVFTILGNSLRKADGSLVDGELTFQVIEMHTPEELIPCQLSTNGLNQSQSVEPLLSEGIFYLSATHNNEPVQVVGEIDVFIPSPNENLNLSIFYPENCDDLDCSILWEHKPGPGVEPMTYTDSTGTSTKGYFSRIDHFGWMNFARYNPDPNPRGILYNRAPTGYTRENGGTFLAYDSESLAVGLFLSFDSQNEVFSEEYGEIPEGTEGSVIFVGRAENQFSFSGTSVIAKDGEITLTHTLHLGSETELVDYINNL